MTAVTFSQGRIDSAYRVSEIATLATGLLLAGSALGLPTAIAALAYLIVVATIVFLFGSRKKDEFLQRHWNAGASVAFFAISLWGLLAPLMIGLFDGLVEAEHRSAAAYKIMADGILPIAFVAFFAAFQISRWRNH